MYEYLRVDIGYMLFILILLAASLIRFATCSVIFSYIHRNKSYYRQNLVMGGLYVLLSTDIMQ